MECEPSIEKDSIESLTVKEDGDVVKDEDKEGKGYEPHKYTPYEFKLMELHFQTYIKGL